MAPVFICLIYRFVADGLENARRSFDGLEKQSPIFELDICMTSLKKNPQLVLLIKKLLDLA